MTFCCPQAFKLAATSGSSQEVVLLLELQDGSLDPSIVKGEKSSMLLNFVRCLNFKHWAEGVKRFVLARGIIWMLCYRASSAPLPFLSFMSSIHPAALALGSTLILTMPSTISTPGLPSASPRLTFLPTFINPPLPVSM